MGATIENMVDMDYMNLSSFEYVVSFHCL